MTLLFHVDESVDSTHHYHAGLLSDGPGLAGVEAALNLLVEQAFDAGACPWKAELHAAEVFHQTGAWEKCTIPLAVDVFDNALGQLAKHRVEVIARGTNLAGFRTKYGATADPYTWNFSNLLERLNERLRDREDYGLVIADQQSQYKESLQRDLANAHEHGTGGYRSSRLERVLDTAHFVDSKLSRMTQLVDMVVWVMRRRASKSSERDPRLEAMMARWHNSILGAVPEPTGRYHTIRS